MLATLGIAVLAHEMTFRGLPFRCLTRAVGPSAAVVLMVLGAGISAWHHAWIPGTGVLASMLLTWLLSMTWLRTHAVWMAWGAAFFAGSLCGGFVWATGGGWGLCFWRWFMEAWMGRIG